MCEQYMLKHGINYESQIFFGISLHFATSFLINSLSHFEQQTSIDEKKKKKIDYSISCFVVNIEWLLHVRSYVINMLIKNLLVRFNRNN